MENALAVKFFEAMFKNSRFLRDKLHSNSEIGTLSILQLRTLSFLNNRKNAQMTEIADYFHIELPSATSLLNKLVTLQLVKRQQDEKDRRLVRVALTEDGNKLLKQAMEQKIKHIEHILSYLTKSEQEELLRLLEKLNTRIEKDYEH